MNNFDKFVLNEKITLTSDEKKYFWSKIEYSRKKKAKESKNDLFKDLNSDGNLELSESDFIKYLNSLEYSIKKQMKDPEKKFRNEIATSFHSKIPSSWIGVKFSNIKAKNTKDLKNTEKEDK